MVQILPSISSSFFLRHESEKCVACVGVSRESLLLTSFQMDEKAEEGQKIEGNEEENFLLYFTFPFIFFFWIFFLLWWYGKLRGRLKLFVSFLLHFSHNFCVIFTKPEKQGEVKEWKWHFRQLKHFSSFAWMVFMTISLHFDFHENYLSFLSLIFFIMLC